MVAFKDLTLDQKREYKRNAYNKNKKEYNLAKIAVGLTSKSRKVRENTLQKYELEKNDNGEYVIPTKYRFQINHNDVKIEPPPPVINV